MADKNILTRLADAGEDAIARLSDAPGADRMLGAVNSMRDRTDDALRSNAYLGAILSSIPQTVVVVDRNLVVTAWSAHATELWGLREDEAIGQHVLDLDIGVQHGVGGR